MSGDQEFLLLGSPIISPKAPRKVLTPTIKKARKSEVKITRPAQDSWTILEPIPLSKTSQVQTGRRSKRPGHDKDSPLRRGRSILSDGGRRGRSPVEWDSQQHWSEVKMSSFHRIT